MMRFLRHTEADEAVHEAIGLTAETARSIVGLVGVPVSIGVQSLRNLSAAKPLARYLPA